MENSVQIYDSGILNIGTGPLSEIFLMLDWKSKTRVSITCKTLLKLFREFANMILSQKTGSELLRDLFRKNLYFEISIINLGEFSIFDICETLRIALICTSKSNESIVFRTLRRLLEIDRSQINPDEISVFNIISSIYDDGEMPLTTDIAKNHVFMDILVYACLFSRKPEKFRYLLAMDVSLNSKDSWNMFKPILVKFILLDYWKIRDSIYIQALVDTGYFWNTGYYSKNTEIAKILTKEGFYQKAETFISRCLRGNKSINLVGIESCLEYDAPNYFRSYITRCIQEIGFRNNYPGNC